MTDSLHAHWTMEEILRRHTGARRALFRAFHIGGCASCGFQPEETLAEVCRRNEDLDPAKAVAVILAAQAEEDALQWTAVELAERRKNFPGILVVDIRSREEHEAVKIPGAELLTQELSQQLLQGPAREGAVVFCDHQGQHVMDAVSYFIGHGLKEAYGLKGGIDAWAREVDPSMPRYQIS